MAKRKPIPKSVRAEVLKRDMFRCQYCGRSATDLTEDGSRVILEIDHIVPVSKGGDNSVMNLITSCRDCNRGKGARMLSDETILAKQKKQMDDIQYQREMIEMMAEWRAELMEETEREVGIIDDYISSISDWSLSNNGKQGIRRLIKRFGFNEVYESVQIAFDKYFNGSDDSWEIAFGKVGGICYNRKVGRGADYYGS